MQVTYLSHPITNDTPSYGNRDEIRITPQNEISKGDTANTSGVYISNNHIGTHVDVPKHFYDDGKTITDLEPKEWVFNHITLIDISCQKAKLIDIKDLELLDISAKTEFLIIRTGFEKKRGTKAYWNAYPSISPGACVFLRQKYSNLRAVGFDFISLTSPLFKEAGKESHKILLEEKGGEFIFIIEDMKIGHLEKAPNTLIMAPLLINQGNGGPVTIFAL